MPEPVRLFDPDELDGTNYRPLDPTRVKELECSIAEHGQMHPIPVVETTNGHEAVGGFHRIAACRNLGVKVAGRVYPATLTVAQRIALGLSENLHQKCPDRISVAIRMSELNDAVGGSIQETARLLGKNAPFVCRYLKILDVGDRLWELVRTKKLQMRAAYALSQVARSPAEQETMIARATNEKMTVDRVEQLVREWKKPKQAVRKFSRLIASGVSLSLQISGSLASREVVKALEEFLREVKRAAGHHSEVKDFLTRLSLERTAEGTLGSPDRPLQVAST